MSRDGSDSDYLRENGYGFLVEGDIPSSWGDDDSSSIKKDLVFDNFQEAKEWSLANNGQAFTRNPVGSGFVPKRKF
ncbi:hypothetical protein [Shewanella algae]|uniref:Uncharacterized protein n=1 Tax=Shewanella algae TaxID=38313 RepID=A0A379Z3G7_9GAMM|nr:hypothetical protein [Shewanella algae]MBO2606399.1 hypothetical protein [Shewanella algae]SUI54567.1 Uncharacterised protein [Shewanella algae]